MFFKCHPTVPAFDARVKGAVFFIYDGLSALQPHFGNLNSPCHF